MKDIIIVGSGPAGHTAAIYSARAGLNTTLFEGWMAGGVAPGGQLTTTNEIENFPGFPEGMTGPELMVIIRKQSVKQGVEIFTETVESIDLSSRPFKIKTSSREMETAVLIVATGAIARRMGVPNEEKFWQKGISACAVCDGALPLFRNQPLVVIGGGDTAMEEAMHLSKFGSKIYVVHRRDELRASKAMQKRVLANDKIEILWNTVMLDVGGSDVLEYVLLKNIKTDKEFKQEVKGLFYAIGHTPNTAFLDGQLDLDDAGYILTNPGTTVTSIPGVYAAGDVQDKVYRQAITSAGTGCMASLEAAKYLEENPL